MTERGEGWMDENFIENVFSTMLILPSLFFLTSTRSISTFRLHHLRGALAVASSQSSLASLSLYAQPVVAVAVLEPFKRRGKLARPKSSLFGRCSSFPFQRGGGHVDSVS